MFQPSYCFSFGTKARHVALAHVPLCQDHFEGHEALEPGLSGFVDNAHAAAA